MLLCQLGVRLSIIIHPQVKRKIKRHPQVKRKAYHGHKAISPRKGFLDKTVLFDYNGTNMPYVTFYNQIMNLIARCP